MTDDQWSRSWWCWFTRLSTRDFQLHTHAGKKFQFCFLLLFSYIFSGNLCSHKIYSIQCYIVWKVPQQHEVTHFQITLMLIIKIQINFMMWWATELMMTFNSNVVISPCRDLRSLWSVMWKKTLASLALILRKYFLTRLSSCHIHCAVLSLIVME